MDLEKLNKDYEEAKKEIEAKKKIIEKFLISFTNLIPL